MGNRIINPGEVKAQTSTMIASLQGNNEALQNIKGTIENFAYEQELSGVAWEKGKQYMREGHFTVIQGLLCANSSMISAATQYAALVGDEILDEWELNEKIEVLEGQVNMYRSLIRDAEMRRYTENSVGAGYVIPIYNGYIGLCESLIRTYEAKIDKIGEIECSGEALFDQAGGLYITAKSAVEALGNSWTGTSFDLSVLNGRWKSKLDKQYSEFLFESFYIRDESGKITGYNYKEISRLLNKDPDRITDTEYAAIAYLFVMEDDVKVKEWLINECYDLVEDGVKQLEEGGGITTVTVISTRTEKLDRILEKILVLEAGIYTGVAAVKTEEERKAICATGILGKVQQSKVLLEQILGSNKELAVVSRSSLYNGHQNVLTDNPITLEREEDGTIRLCYVKGDSKVNRPYTSYKIHTATISPTCSGDTMRGVTEEEDIKWFAQTNGIPTNKSKTYSQLGSDWAAFLLKEGIEKLPVAGDFVSTPSSFVDQIAGSTKVWKGAKTYEQMTNAVQTRQMADNYKLNTVRVTHEEGGESSLNYYVFEGIGDSKNTKTTRQCIENVNENLSPGGDYEEYAKKIDYDSNSPIRLEDILENPQKVMELHNKWVDECPEGYLGSEGLYE